MHTNPAVNRWLVYALLAFGAVYLVRLLSPILTPFLIGVALAYLCDPLVDRLERRGVARGWGTTLVMLGLIMLLLLILAVLTPLAQAQARLLITQIPLLVERAQDVLIPWLRDQFGADLLHDREELQAWLVGHAEQLSKLTAYLPALGDQGLAFVGFLANLLLVPVVTFYLLRDWDKGMASLVGWIPVGIRTWLLNVAGEIDAVLSEFVRGQLAVIAIMALYYSLGLWLVGLHYALAVGLIAGILVFIPYLGVMVGVTLGTLSGLTQYGDFMALLPVWVVFGIGQLLEGMLITPWLVGDRVGLHPLAVIFAVMAFGQLFGFVGVLLAIPAAAALLVGLRHLKPYLLET